MLNLYFYKIKISQALLDSKNTFFYNLSTSVHILISNN